MSLSARAHVSQENAGRTARGIKQTPGGRRGGKLCVNWCVRCGGGEGVTATRYALPTHSKILAYGVVSYKDRW